MKNTRSSFLDFTNPRILTGIIAGVALLIYSNTLTNGYNLDDELVTENHALKNADLNFSTLVNLFSQPYYQDAAGNKYEYRPMVMVTFFFEFLIFGKNPSVGHFINLLLYALTCVLLFRLLRILFGEFKHALLLSFAITLFFVVHPLHTEAVASIKNRDELLSLLFGVSAWLCALRFADKKSIPHYVLYLVLFLAALFSKQTTITFSILIPVSLVLFRQISIGSYLALVLPVAFLASAFSPIYLLVKKAMVFVGATAFLLAFYYLITKRETILSLFKKSDQNTQASVSRKFSYKWVGGIAAVGVVVAITAFLITRPPAENKNEGIRDTIKDFNELQLTPLLNTPAPTVIPVAGRKLDFVETPLLYVDNPNEKIGTSFYALGYYLRLMLVPYPLSFYYGYNQIPISGFGNVFVIISLLAYLAIGIGAFYLLLRNKHIIAAFGMLFFLLAMIPLSNLLTPIAGVVAERLAYAASLGFCIALCYLLLYPAMKEKAAGTKAEKYSLYAFFAIIVLFAGLTFSRNRAWKDHLTLFSADIGHLENSARAHHLYASHLAYTTIGNSRTPESKKKLNEAIPHFKRALEIYPDFPYAYFDLAKTYLLLGDNKSAIDAYTQSIKRDTLVAAPYFELGVVLTDAQRYEEAEKYYLKAIRRDSSFMQAYTNLSYLYYQQGRYEESIAVNQKAIARNPNAYEPLVNLGKTYMRLQDTDRALYYMERAIKINQSDKGMVNAVADIYRLKGDLTKEQYYRNLK